MATTTTRPARDLFSAICHRDGTASYWAVYHQVWVRSTRLPAEEWAARGDTEKRRLERHFARHAV